MKCAGIIAEYNPFHNGHAYHIQRAREASGAEYIIAVMSGSFVQRGEVAICDKFTRARHALMGGADMVIELPTPFVLGSAELFARCGMALLSGTGVADAVCFGSGSGDIELIGACADRLLCETPEQQARLRANLATGMSYPKALSSAIGEEFAPLFSDANDILALEYVKAIRAANASLTPIAIRRKGAAHDALDAVGGFASASAVRRAILTGDTDTIAACTPQYAAEDIIAGMKDGAVPRENRRLSQALLYKLNSMTDAELSRLPDVSEGLENVIRRAAESAADYSGLIAAIKSKRYTMARIKRILMCALLNITADSRDTDGLYLRVLGVRRSALPLLSRMADAATLPVVTRYSDTAALTAPAARLLRTDCFAAFAASLSAPPAAAYQSDFSAPLIIF